MPRLSSDRRRQPVTTEEAKTKKQLAHPGTLPKEADLMRSAVQWIIASFAAVAGALVVGSQLSDVGMLEWALDWEWRSPLCPSLWRRPCSARRIVSTRGLTGPRRPSRTGEQAHPAAGFRVADLAKTVSPRLMDIVID
jgi:hypothetical protein